MNTFKISGIVACAALTVGLAGATETKPADDMAGKISGKVLFEGEYTAPKPLTVSQEQGKGCCVGTDSADCISTQDRSLIVDDKGGIANAVVMISIEGKSAAIPEAPIELDQNKCRFEPHIMVVPVGTTVAYLNSDGVSHNIHTYAVKNETFNKTVSGGSRLEQKLTQPEQVKVTCDIHPWMTGYVVVTDASVWAVTNADGSFEMSGLAPGEYKLDIWHEKLGKAKATATVGAEGAGEAVMIKMGAKKKKGGRRR